MGRGVGVGYHPTHVKKNLTKAINNRLTSISSNENLFNKHKPDYVDALKNSGHRHELKYTPPPNIYDNSNPGRKRNRKRQEIIFTPPYNMSLKTNIGKQFLELIDKHFPKNHILYPIANRKNIKISYSCTKNIGALISGHNNKILNEVNNSNEETKPCNCQIKALCPVKGDCQKEQVVYKARIKESNVFYIGMTGGDFKHRYNQHTHSFRSSARKNSTTLSQYIWEHNLGPFPEIEWSIIHTAKKIKPGFKFCDLCTTEKMFIIKNSKDPNCINKRNDIGTKCCHLNSTKLITA